jgi:hypothetical protein
VVKKVVIKGLKAAAAAAASAAAASAAAVMIKGLKAAAAAAASAAAASVAAVVIKGHGPVTLVEAAATAGRRRARKPQMRTRRGYCSGKMHLLLGSTPKTLILKLGLWWRGRRYQKRTLRRLRRLR